MGKKIIFFLIGAFIFFLNSKAQDSRYIIQLKDKTGTPFSISQPLQYLTQRAIDRRARYGIAIDSTDLPVNPAYVDSIRLSGNVIILYTSKWRNEVCIKTTDAAALAKINSFPFVQSTTAIAPRPALVNRQVIDLVNRSASTNPDGNILSVENASNYYSYGLSYAQIHLHNGDFLHNHGFRGQNMIMAITDDGFYHYQTLPCFDSAINNQQILGTWDFVVGDSNVNEQDNHGERCFSTIASNLPGTFVGTAPGASFYLFRTEDASTEFHIEEHNWVAAAERADSLGVNSFSISLGYLDFDDSTTYTYNDLNGHTTIISKGVNMAVSKGMLVIAANGNYGAGYSSPVIVNGQPIISNYHWMTTPGDADSVLAVGAINTSGQVASFSSHGPNSSGQAKPDVSAVGWGAYVSNYAGTITTDDGTSFACPIMAGLTTCLWQAFPEVNSRGIITAIRLSSNRYNHPDSLYGYGIPDMKKAFVSLIQKLHTQQVILPSCQASISWSAKSDSTMSFVVQRKLPTDTNYKTLYTQNFTGGFVTRNCNFIDDLSSLLIGTTVNYRIQMNIASDTSFYLDSAAVTYLQPCVVYRFTGNGDWTVASNWLNNAIPPDTLLVGDSIIIDPAVGGVVKLDKVRLYVGPHSTITVRAGNLIIPGELKIE